MITSFQRGMHMRFWLNHPDCPPVLKACKAVIDKALRGRDTNMRSHDISAETGVDTASDGHLLAVADPELARLLGTASAFVKARHRSSVDGNMYCQASTHTGNSLIIYSPAGDERNEPVYASIQHICRRDADENWKFVVKHQRQVQVEADPYMEWPDFKGKLFSSSLDPELHVVEEKWVRARYVRWTLLRDASFAATIAMYQVTIPSVLSRLWCLPSEGLGRECGVMREWENVVLEISKISVVSGGEVKEAS